MSKSSADQDRDLLTGNLAMLDRLAEYATSEEAGQVDLPLPGLDATAAAFLRTESGRRAVQNWLKTAQPVIESLHDYAQIDELTRSSSRVPQTDADVQAAKDAREASFLAISALIRRLTSQSRQAS